MVNVRWLWLAFLMPACPATDGFLGRSLIPSKTGLEARIADHERHHNLLWYNTLDIWIYEDSVD